MIERMDVPAPLPADLGMAFVAVDLDLPDRHLARALILGGSRLAWEGIGRGGAS